MKSTVDASHDKSFVIRVGQELLDSLCLLISIDGVPHRRKWRCLPLELSNSQQDDRGVSQRDEDQRIEDQVQGSIPRNDHSSSVLYTMFLPQEREMIARMQRRARERQEAQRMTFFVKAGVGISVVLVSLVLILYVTKLVRLHLL